MSASTNHSDDPLEKYKIIFLGDESVGKTSIITRFVSDTFDPICRVMFKIIYFEYK